MVPERLLPLYIACQQPVSSVVTAVHMRDCRYVRRNVCLLAANDLPDRNTTPGNTPLVGIADNVQPRDWSLPYFVERLLCMVLLAPTTQVVLKYG